MISNNLKISVKTALIASQEILSIYDSYDINFTLKEDNSPITEADKISHETIMEGLKSTKYPILSEEGIKIKYSERKNWKKFWLIDPLDGTKEFVKRNGEFTVNIALIENEIPVLGVVYAPVSKELYFAEKNLGAFKVEGIVKFSELEKLNKIDLSKTSWPNYYTIVVSRSHMNDQTLDIIEEKKKNYNKVIIKEFGSSLKICKVAESKVNFYPRLGPTLEWDTAAAHAIVKYSGKKIQKFGTKEELSYNKESLINPYFIVH